MVATVHGVAKSWTKLNQISTAPRKRERAQTHMLLLVLLFLIKLHTVSHQRRQWYSNPVLLPGKSHGRRSLVGCSPWGRSESDTTERLHFHFSLSCIGEGNGNPLLPGESQGRGSLVAAIYGVTQSQTRLK